MTETDAVVAGAGMAGLVAAAHLVQADRDVVVLEKADEPGGSLAISNGIVWTYLPYASLRDRAPKGDPALHRVLAERFEEDLTWLGELGVELEQPTFDVPAAGKEIDPPQFVTHMVDLIAAGDGEVRTNAPLDSLVVEDGAVSGVRVAGPDQMTTIDAGATIIATGGFQGNERLLEQYVTADAANLYLRSAPGCTGDGYLAATDIGAKTTGGHGGFYGHTLAAPPAEFSMDEFADATQYYGYAAVALDRHGERFTDESESELEETLAQDVAAHTNGRAYYVFDGTIADETFGYHSAAHIAETAGELGGRSATVETMHDLEATLESWGVNGRRAGETIRAYNRAIRAGRQPDPPRLAERHTIDEPPYYVVEVKPAITFTMGGLAVTPAMAVKRRSLAASDLSMAPEPSEPGVVPNLYAAGNDVGNVHRRTYVGGLAHALVSGRVAAESVDAALN